MNKKEKLMQFIKKLPSKTIAKALLYILLLTAFFGILAMFSGLGYSGKAHINHIEANSALGYIIVDADIDITFNPILYPLSWLYERGHIAGPIKSVSLMEHPGHWRLGDLEDNVLFSAALGEITKNLLFIFVIVTATEITRQRKLHLCLFAGVLGFYFGGFIGAIVGLFIGGFSIFLVMPYIEKFGYDWFLEENERANRVLD